MRRFHRRPLALLLTLILLLELFPADAQAAESSGGAAHAAVSADAEEPLPDTGDSSEVPPSDPSDVPSADSSTPLGPIGVQAGSAPRGIMGNGTGGIYININAAPYNTIFTAHEYQYGWEQYAYAKQGCAWYASARVNQLTGKGTTIFSGHSWYYTQYKNLGFTRGSTPKTKSLACYSNHVAVVEAVDGDSILVSEGGTAGLSDAEHGYCAITETTQASLESPNRHCGTFYGYVYLESSPAPDAPPVISNLNPPTALTQGSSFSIQGTVRSDSAITSLTAGIYDSENTLLSGKTVKPNAVRYDLKKLASSLLFSKLPAGVYAYQICAKNAAGTTTKRRVFTVLSRKDTIPSGTYVLQPAGNAALAVGVAGRSSKVCAAIQLQPLSSNGSQIFWIKSAGNGYYTLTNDTSGLCLDVPYAAADSGTALHQYFPKNNSAQRWQILPVGDSYCLVPECAKANCMAPQGGRLSKNTSLQSANVNLSAAQRFKLVQTDCGTPRETVTFDLRGGAVRGSSFSHKVAGFNTNRGENEVVIYNVAGASSGTNSYGREAAVDANGIVTAIRESGSSAQLIIPSGGFVVSGHNGAFVKDLSLGQYVGYDLRSRTVSAYSSRDLYLLYHKNVSPDTKCGALPVPYRDGYTFTGWYTKDGERITASSPCSANILYARWKKVQLENRISASNITRTYSSKAQTFSIGATQTGDAKLSYHSNHQSVSVDRAGTVTVKAKFVGSAVITITAKATSGYSEAVKRITVTVLPARTSLTGAIDSGGGNINVQWKRNVSGTGYLIQYTTNNKFKNPKRLIIRKNTITSAEISKLTRGKTYYIRIRAYKSVSGKNYYSAWSDVKKVTLRK